MNLEICPKCETKLNVLPSSGRQICPSCKWMNQVETNKIKEKNNTNDEELKKDQKEEFLLLSEEAIANNKKLINNFFGDKSIETISKIFFLFGIVTMLFGGLFYPTTVCDRDSYYKSCTHNIGLLNARSNIVNIGGFLFISGSILLGKSRRD